MNLGDKIKNLRTSAKMSQTDLAKKIRITQASLSSYENNNILPSIDILLRIANFFNVSLDWLCSNQYTRKFVTGEDIIDLFMELQTIPGFDYDIMVSDDDPDTVSFKFKGKPDSSDMVFGSGEFVQFFRELAEINEKYKTSNDPEFVKSYFDMWIEKKRDYYSTLAVEYKELDKN